MSKGLRSVVRTPAFHREIHHVRPVEDTPAKLLEAIGYEQYAKALQEKGCGTMAQLQFVNLDALLSCGVLPVHAAHMFALIQNSLGNPPVLQDTETNDPKPVRVYICAASPPVINTVGVHDMTCHMEILFDAVWVDPRLRQSDKTEIGDPVVAPHFWQPRFGCAGATGMQFELVRAVYLDPAQGILRCQYRGKGECPLTSANDQGHVVIKLKLKLMRFTEKYVELWSPRHARASDIGVGMLDDGWSRLTDFEWENEQGQRFLDPKEFSEQFIKCPEYRLCNRHGYTEDEQDDWLKVDECVGFQVLTSTYGKELEEDLGVSLMLEDVREDAESKKARKKTLLEKLAYLDDGSEKSIKLFRRHYFGRRRRAESAAVVQAMKAEEVNRRATRMVDQLIDMRREIIQGNADQQEWTECPVDGDTATVRAKEKFNELTSQFLAPLEQRARDAGLSEEKVAAANSPDGRKVALARLIIQKEDKLGKRSKSATHGWCQSQVDNTLASPNFSVFQLTIRLQRLEEFYYLNPSLVSQPRSLSQLDDQRRKQDDQQFHVWVQSTVHSLKDIHAASSSIFVKLHTTAYWIDRRLRTAMSHRRVLSKDHVWYPQLDVTSKESMEVSLLRLELINADTGLVRADYALVGTLHNHMTLHEFPLDADTISVELFCKRDQYQDVCLHTGDDAYEPSFDSRKLSRNGSTVVDALTASRRLTKQHTQEARASHRLLQEKMLEPGTTDDSLGAGSEFTIVDGMCVFHSRGLPEVVAKYRIFTLEELDIHIMNESIVAEEGNQAYINPVHATDDVEDATPVESTTPTTVAQMRSNSSKKDFADFAATLSIQELELLAESHGLHTQSLSKRLGFMLVCKDYKQHLIRKLGRFADEDKQLDADEGVTHSNGGYPMALKDVTLLADAKKLHEWTVVDSCAEETSGLKVIVKLRIHRQAGFYFWKILFVLHLLVYATLASFFFPGDPEGVAVRVSISSTMFLALCGLLNVASETLPKLEYLTDCDKIIMLSTVIVFLVNVWNCILLLVWNSTGEYIGDGTAAAAAAAGGEGGVDTVVAEPGFFENVEWFGVPGSAATIHPLPFQQTCPKMETLRLPYRGFWGSFLRSSFGALMPRMGINRAGGKQRGDGKDSDVIFAVPSETDNCTASRLDENFAWLLGVVYHIAYFLLFAPTLRARFKEKAALSKEGSWKRLFFARKALAITLKDAAATDKKVRDHLEDKARRSTKKKKR